jgi:hypothetical protein
MRGKSGYGLLLYLTNLPAKASADLKLEIMRYCSLNPIDAGYSKVQPVIFKSSPQIGLDFLVLLCQEKRTYLVQILSFLSLPRKEKKQKKGHRCL